MSFFLVLMVFNSCFAEPPSCSRILEYIQGQLPHVGVLKNSNGFLYVDVDNEYVHKSILFIQDNGFEEPPYFGNSDLVGAHISVIYPDEVEKYKINEIQECGNTICFSPKGCQVVRPPDWPEIEALYFIVVEAPELDRIRKKYGLPKREYEFHITIGVKPKVGEAALNNRKEESAREAFLS